MSWDATGSDISAWTTWVFDEFNRKAAELRAYSICKCSACDSIDYLRLKVVVHTGDVLPHKIGPFYELAGLDVTLYIGYWKTLLLQISTF